MNNNKPNKESAREGAFSLIFNSVIPREYYHSVMIVVLGTNTTNRQKNISSEASLGGLGALTHDTTRRTSVEMKRM